MKRLEIYFDGHVFKSTAIVQVAKMAVRKGFSVHLVASELFSYQCGPNKSPALWGTGDLPEPKKSWLGNLFKKEDLTAPVWVDGFNVYHGDGAACPGDKVILLGTADRYGYKVKYGLDLKEVKTIEDVRKAILEWAE